TVMLRFVAFLLCVTAACADFMPKIGFKLYEVKNRWNEVQILTSHTMSMKMGLALLEPTSDGDLDLGLFFSNLENLQNAHFIITYVGCKRMFFYSLSGWGNDNDMRMVDVKPDEFVLVHTIKTKGEGEVLNHLYGHTKDLSPDLKKRFQEFSLETGLKHENIILPPNGNISHIGTFADLF
uniref:Lipocalin/cytosolic fatty-acid binding domain-containing protein n=1 Tax=Pygocentrus nattereri TaxID=42514 RepID=A0A3B4E5Q1_PYGNA